MKRILAVLMLYRERVLFLTLALGLGVVLAMGKVFVVKEQWFLFDELITVWLCIWMTLAFQSGIMIKRQMASPMARLIPGYRAVHIAVGGLLWLGVAVVTAWWLSGLTDLVGWRVKAAWIILCLGAYLATVVFAYISERMILFIGYGVMLLIVGQTRDILHLLIVSDAVFFGLMAGGILLFIGFLWRLAVLSEGMAEYPFVLSWPMHRAKTQGASRPYAYRRVPEYAQKKSLISQAFHWAYMEDEDALGIGGMLLGVAVVFSAYVMFFGGSTGFYAHPYANFLVFIAAPLVVMLCFYYRSVAFRDYALLRPVRRQALAVQWGVLLSVALLAAWVMTSILLAVIPALLWGSPLIHSSRFWVYLVYTGVFAQMTLAWLMYVATWKDQRVAMGLVLLYGVYALVELWSVPAYSVPAILWHTGLAAMLGIIFAGKAYQRWCAEEV